MKHGANEDVGDLSSSKNDQNLQMKFCPVAENKKTTLLTLINLELEGLILLMRIYMIRYKLRNLDKAVTPNAEVSNIDSYNESLSSENN